jgi:hypothetical protein
VSVRIVSKLHPAGRLYELRGVDALTEADQRELVELHRKAAALLARPRPGLRAKFRVARAVDAAVALLLPDLEPAVLRRLPPSAGLRVLDHWAELEAGGV